MGENGAQMRPFVPLVVGLLLVGTAGAVVSTPQSGDYSMSSPGEIEIPARDLTVDGEEYTVRAVGRVDPGDTARVDVSAPEDAEYNVYLYNRDLQIEATDAMSGSGRATFPTDGLSPGSYLAAVYDGEILEVYPVVVEGYGVTTDAPGTVDGEFAVNVSVADGALASEPPEVQVVLGDDGRSVRVTANRVAEGEYRATLPTDGFEPGTYALYGVVRGEEETEGGDRVILAISDRHEVRLATSTPTPTATAGGGGGGGQPGDDDGGDVEIRDLELLNGSVGTGQPVVVRADLANFDPVQGRITLTLAAEGTTVAERTVSVGASSERSVLVRTAFDTPGTYRVALDGRDLGSVTVTAAGTPTTAPPAGTATPTPAGVATPTPTDEAVVTPGPTTAAPSPTTTGADGAGFGAAAAAIAVALAVLALGRQ